MVLEEEGDVGQARLMSSSAATVTSRPVSRPQHDSGRRQLERQCPPSKKLVPLIGSSLLRSMSTSHPNHKHSLPEACAHSSSSSVKISEVPLSSLPLHNTPPSAPRQASSSAASKLKRALPTPARPLCPQIRKSSRRWLLTFALINFDLDEGPDFDNCYPRDIEFDANQMSNIAFSSFPDCARVGSLIFNWRIPIHYHKSIKNIPSYPDCDDGDEDDEQLEHQEDKSRSAGRGCDSAERAREQGTRRNKTRMRRKPVSDLYGYVYFVQEKDPNVLRGYVQRSIVLITELKDFAGLFTTVISRLGPLYASQGPEVLETALHNIASWPDPIPGSCVELPLLGQAHTFLIPLAHQPQLLESRVHNKSSIHGQILASTPPTYLSSILFGFTSSKGSHSSSSSSQMRSTFSVSALNFPSMPSHNGAGLIWLLWEILLLGEPLIVFGNSIDLVSEAVVHLRNLIKPIPFQGDWRPYITIHDPDFPNLFNKNKVRTTGTLVGVTNPIIFFNNHQANWPHTLSIGGSSFAAIKPAGHSSLQAAGWSTTNAANAGSTGSGESPVGGSPGNSSHQIGLFTERKRHIVKDKSVVREIEACLDRHDYHQADVVISRHFSLLTEQFLQPLQRYFTTLLPFDFSLSQPQRPGSFNEEVFFKSLKLHATALEFKSSRLQIGLSGVGFTSGSSSSSSNSHGHGYSTINPSGAGNSGPSGGSFQTTSITTGFYAKFLRCDHFLGWLNHQIAVADRAGRMRYLSRLESPHELEKWVAGGVKSEEEVSELLDRIEAELRRQEEEGPDGKGRRGKHKGRGSIDLTSLSTYQESSMMDKRGGPLHEEPKEIDGPFPRGGLGRMKGSSRPVRPGSQLMRNVFSVDSYGWTSQPPKAVLGEHQPSNRAAAATARHSVDIAPGVAEPRGGSSRAEGVLGEVARVEKNTRTEKLRAQAERLRSIRLILFHHH